MKAAHFFRDRFFMVLFQLLAMLLLALFLRSAGNSWGTVAVVAAGWAVFLAVSLLLRFLAERRHLNRLLKLAEGLKERYLIAEVMDKPVRAEEEVYFRLLGMAEKSMLEQVSAARRERREYREYIEQWIHEIKTPLTALKLLCDNNKSEFTRTMRAELEKLNHFAEQALYFARSEAVEKDYLIRETLLSDIIHQAVADNRQLLISGGIQVSLTDCGQVVFTDEKWVCFMLNQVIGNAVKYAGPNPSIAFRALAREEGTVLEVHDNGIGIPANDLPRVFDKGFTGENGRNLKSSTGIGLYLCRRLCDKLGIGLNAASDENGTTISFFFRKNHFCRVQD